MNHRLFFMLVVGLLTNCSVKERQTDEPAMSLSKGPRIEIPRGEAPLASVELGSAYFDYDKAYLRPEAQKTLRKNALWLKSNPTTRVQIEGFCDELGSDEYNRELGERRANAAKLFLINHGVKETRLIALGVGRIPGAGDSTRAKNRRAGFIVFYD